jgi:hypothetical protein
MRRTHTYKRANRTAEAKPGKHTRRKSHGKAEMAKDEHPEQKSGRAKPRN